MVVVLAVVSCLMTLVGGVAAMRVRHHRHLVLGLVGGLILGISAFDLVPESLELSDLAVLGVPAPMAGFACGFLLLHVIEQATAIHQAHENAYALHHHRHGPQGDQAFGGDQVRGGGGRKCGGGHGHGTGGRHGHGTGGGHGHGTGGGHGHGTGGEQGKVGLVAASALVGHSFVDGLSIGLGFQSGTSVGIFVAMAVIAHDFADGFNTFTAASLHRTDRGPAITLLIADSLAPVAGAVVTLFVQVPKAALGPYLGFFAGVLLYLAAAEILPEAHSRHPSALTLCATGFGVLAVMLIVGIAG
ncbi:ZIP family metal transporter [Actinomadura fulvescens]|uniref:Permease n=1 Tax=Actinomadura fulvescens TaxID=46160 RepID=A0ABP6CK53_9ACTN